MGLIDAAWAADVEDARRLLARRYAWFPALEAPRQQAFAAMYAELGPVDDADWKRVAEAAARGAHQMASASILLSKWAGRAGQRAWRIAQVVRTGTDEIHKESPQ